MFLMLENGSMQRHETGKRDPTIVLFDSYAFRPVAVRERPADHQIFGARALSLGAFQADPDDPHVRGPAGQIRAEFHDRITAPLYPLAFVVIDLRLSRRAAHDAAEPHHVAARRDRRGARRCAASASSA